MPRRLHASLSGSASWDGPKILTVDPCTLLNCVLVQIL